MEKNCKSKNFFIGVLIVFLSFSFSLLFGCTSKYEHEEYSSNVFVLHASGRVEVDGTTYTYTNTINNFEEAYNNGFRYYEYDFMLSKDGRIIGSHNDEYLNGYTSSEITYEVYTNLDILGGLQGVTIENISEKLLQHPDAYIVFDTKVDSTSNYLEIFDELINELESLNYSSLIKNFIPQLYSIEMWNSMKDRYAFTSYIYTNYKASYSKEIICDNFSDSRIIYITMWDSTDESVIKYVRSHGHKVLLHTTNDETTMIRLREIGANGFYTDLVSPPNIE